MSKKNNYDSDFCGSLPLNHINVIQSYGYLVVLESKKFNFIQVSENVVDLLSLELSEIIGKSLNDFTNIDHLKELQERFENKSIDKIPLTLNIAGNFLMALAHFKTDYIILELEKPQLVNERSFTNVYEEVKYAMAAIELADTVEDASRAAVHELKKLTGFDGIMMYRFDSDWNGMVIAQEKTAPELEDYMGHTFPASDIPKQARALYLKNAYRLIPDRDFASVRLYPVINSATNTFIDLSDCNLRGVAAVHLEYLKNMNVSSSMSIRVIHNGALWGLIACHHVKPHYLNFELCSICELLSSVISNKISGILHKHDFDTKAKLQENQNALVTQIYAADDLLSGIIKTENSRLQNMFNASGIAVTYNGKYQFQGMVPDKDLVENIILWLQSKASGDAIFNTDQLPELFEEALSYGNIASGMLAIPINNEKGEYIICFRPEVVQTINWGGDPGTAISFDPDRRKYHPRASFKIWQQLIHHTAKPWNEFELKAAENVRTFIYEFTTKQTKA